MRNIILLIIACVFSISFIFSQCPTGGFTLKTQEEVDSFIIKYADCTEYFGWLTINGDSSITNLSGLRNVESIGGGLIINHNTNLTNLEGLNNLKSIGSDFAIYNNRSLTNFKGLENLEKIGGYFIVTGNHALIDLEGVENLSYIGNHVEIGLGLFYYDHFYTRYIGNDSLQSLKGLDGLLKIGGSLVIVNHISLKSLNSLQNLETVEGGLYISSNDSLSNLTGLQNLNSLHQVRIRDNPLLSNLNGLQNINIIRGDFNIENNQILTSLSGLKNLSSVKGHFRIEDCDALVNLSGLNNLTTVSGGLSIGGNDIIVNLVGLENLVAVEGRKGLFVGGNEALTNFSGLESLESLSILTIANSPELIDLSGLGEITSLGNFTIRNNIALKDLSGLDKLKSIHYNLLIEGNNTLEDLSALNNLTSIGSSLVIKDNTALNNCSIHRICKYLTSYGSRVIENNSTDCNSAENVLQNCKETATIKTHFFYDKNQNKILDMDEPPIPIGSVDINNGETKIVANPLTGIGSCVVNPGEYKVSINVNTLPNWSLTTDTLSYNFVLTEAECKTVIYGFYPTEVISKIQPIINTPLTKCSDTIPFWVTARNTATSTASGTLWFEVDSNTVSTLFVDEPDTISSPNRFGWMFENLAPGRAITQQIDLVINISDSLMYFKSYIDFKDENGTQQSDSIIYKTKGSCAFAKSKTVEPNRNCDYILFHEPIIYTIQFQNKSIDAASKLTIVESVDSSLDLATFSLIGSSHLQNLSTTINELGNVVFEFNDINLPNSGHYSYGYINYSIKAKKSLSDYTIIQSHTTAYVDYNIPVSIGSVKSVLVSEIDEAIYNCRSSQFDVWCRDADGDGLGQSGYSIYCCIQPEGFVDNCSDPDDLVSISENNLNDSINIYPNPSNGIFKIDFWGVYFQKALVGLYSVNGQQISPPINLKQNQKWLEYASLNNGIYYLIFELDDVVIKKKIVIIK